MKYSPEIDHRRSIRLQRYDYSKPGAYFVTICTHNRECLFGDIMDRKLVLNQAGYMVIRWYHELKNKFPDIQCDEFTCMPNHIHFIVINVGADLCVCPDTMGEHVGRGKYIGKGEHTDTRGEHIGSPLPRVVQWFKTMTTNDYIKNVKNNNWKPFDKKLWQRNYYEHVIRNESELNKIREYIIYNPHNWINDDYFRG